MAVSRQDNRPARPTATDESDPFGRVYAHTHADVDPAVGAPGRRGACDFDQIVGCVAR